MAKNKDKKTPVSKAAQDVVDSNVSAVYADISEPALPEEEEPEELEAVEENEADKIIREEIEKETREMLDENDTPKSGDQDSDVVEFEELTDDEAGTSKPQKVFIDLHAMSIEKTLMGVDGTAGRLLASLAVGGNPHPVDIKRYKLSETDPTLLKGAAHNIAQMTGGKIKKFLNETPLGIGVQLLFAYGQMGAAAFFESQARKANKKNNGQSQYQASKPPPQPTPPAANPPGEAKSPQPQTPDKKEPSKNSQII